MDKKLRLDARVRMQFQLSWGKARSHVETGKIQVDGQVQRDPGVIISETSVITLQMNAPREIRPAAQPAGKQATAPKVIHLDTQIVVVSKPAGMSTVPYENEEDHSLEKWVCDRISQSRVFIVQRLDRETSGLVVFARNNPAFKSLSNQFRFHTVLRRYFALAHGHVQSQTIRSELVLDRGDGLRGSRAATSSVSRYLAKPAITHVSALAKLGAMTLIECKLETGRTHQIRIHLSEAGHPLVGERVYIRDFQHTPIKAPRLMLHAAELGIQHPSRETAMHWTELPPEDFLALISSGHQELLKKRLQSGTGK